MEQNKILNIIITLLEGAKTEKRILIDKDLALHECSYLLNQTIRQYEIPKDHVLVSKKAKELWEQLSTKSIFDYRYKDQIKKDTDGETTISLYRGAEKNPYSKKTISKGDTFTYKDVFTDEHTITVSDIIKGLSVLEDPNPEYVKEILDKVYICKMLKAEDRSIQAKKHRGTSLDYKEAIRNHYNGIDVLDHNGESIR